MIREQLLKVKFDNKGHDRIIQVTLCSKLGLDQVFKIFPKIAPFNLQKILYLIRNFAAETDIERIELLAALTDEHQARIGDAPARGNVQTR